MSILREDPEIDAVIAKEREGSGNFGSGDDIVIKLLQRKIKDLTPQPGPGYYAFHEHRIFTAKPETIALRKKLEGQLEKCLKTREDYAS